jgi:drug/metabolite transporter superfamily protein YnfA
MNNSEFKRPWRLTFVVVVERCAEFDIVCLLAYSTPMAAGRVYAAYKGYIDEQH